MRKEGMMIGAGIIMIQVVHSGLKICFCENLFLKENMINAAAPFFVLMCICTIYINIRGLYKTRMNLQNGIMCCLLAGSIGTVESVASGNFFLYALGGILGFVTGILASNYILSERTEKAKKVSNGIYLTIGLVIGPWGARYFLKALGQDRAEKLVLCLIIVLEIFFMMLGVGLLRIELSKRNHCQNKG